MSDLTLSNRRLTELLALALVLSLAVQLNPAKFGRADPYEVMIYNDPPLISVNSPTQNNVYASTALLNFSITKSAGWLISAIEPQATYRNELQNIEVLIDGQSYEVVNANSYLSTPFNRIEALNNLTDGTHTLLLVAFCSGWNLELHGLWSKYLVFNGTSELIQFEVHTHPPKIALLSIDNEIYHTNNVALNFTVDAPTAKIQCTLDNGSDKTITGNTTLAGLQNGRHNITVYATDEFGHTGTSTATFTVEAKQPFPTLVLPVSVTVVITGVAAGIALKLYFKRRRAKAKAHSRNKKKDCT